MPYNVDDVAHATGATLTVSRISVSRVLDLSTITVRSDGDRVALDVKGDGLSVTLLLDAETALRVANGVTDTLTAMGFADNFTVAVNK